VDALRQLVGRHRKTCCVPTRIREIAKSFEETERLEDGGIYADADAVVASFDLAKGGAGGEGAFGDDFGRQSATPARVTDVLSELAQGTSNRKRRSVRSRHYENIAFRYSGIM